MGGQRRPRSLWRVSYAGLMRSGMTGRRCSARRGEARVSGCAVPERGSPEATWISRVPAEHENEQPEDEAGRGAEDGPAGHAGRALDELADQETGQGAERERQEEAGPV